jgi:hypothetical protein
MNILLTLGMLVDDEYLSNDYISRIMPSGLLLSPELNLELFAKDPKQVAYMRRANATTDYLFEIITTGINGQVYKVKRRILNKVLSPAIIHGGRIFLNLNMPHFTLEGAALYRDLDFTFEKIQKSLEYKYTIFKRKNGYPMSLFQLIDYLQTLNIDSFNLFEPAWLY